MADKKSFVFYHDWGKILKKLPLEEVGNITIALIAYSESGVIPTLSPIADIAFTALKQAIDRDFEKWESTCQVRSENGKKGGRPKKANGFSENQNNPNAFLAFSEKPKKADSVNDNVNDNVNDLEYEGENENESDKYAPGGSPSPHSKANMQNDTNAMQNQANESNGDTNLCTNTNTNTITNTNNQIHLEGSV